MSKFSTHIYLVELSTYYNNDKIYIIAMKLFNL